VEITTDAADEVLNDNQFDLTEWDEESNIAKSLRQVVIEQEKEKPVIKEEDPRDFKFDNLAKDRTGDKLRKNLLSKLTYEKIWLTP
jgi:hypothetical protein